MYKDLAKKSNYSTPSRINFFKLYAIFYADSWDNSVARAICVCLLAKIKYKIAEVEIVFKKSP